MSANFAKINYYVKLNYGGPSKESKGTGSGPEVGRKWNAIAYLCFDFS